MMGAQGVMNRMIDGMQPWDKVAGARLEQLQTGDATRPPQCDGTDQTLPHLTVHTPAPVYRSSA